MVIRDNPLTQNIKDHNDAGGANGDDGVEGKEESPERKSVPSGIPFRRRLTSQLPCAGLDGRDSVVPWQRSREEARNVNFTSLNVIHVHILQDQSPYRYTSPWWAYTYPASQKAGKKESDWLKQTVRKQVKFTQPERCFQAPGSLPCSLSLKSYGG